MNPFTVAIVAIIAWAIVQMSRNKSKGGPNWAELDALKKRLDASEAERERLNQRVQNLEAIATAESLELGAGEPRLELPNEVEETPEEETARLARRARS